jgi:hypothetical protein
MPRSTDLVDRTESAYVLQCRRQPKNPDAAPEPWLLYADDHLTITERGPDGSDVYRNVQVRDYLAPAIWQAVKTFMVGFRDHDRLIQAVPNLPDALLCLVIVHRINPGPFDWRIASRHVRVLVYDEPVDHRELTTEWRRSIPYPEDRSRQTIDKSTDAS